ncbi:MAG: hypothetical protein M3112_09490 [Actinomycetia bacterium]|nr:hypothetical protein [Actinomycetes bacterium]
MPLVIGLVVVLAVAVAIVLFSRRSHDADDYYALGPEGPPVIHSTCPSGLD